MLTASLPLLGPVPDALCDEADRKVTTFRMFAGQAGQGDGGAGAPRRRGARSRARGAARVAGAGARVPERPLQQPDGVLDAPERMAGGGGALGRTVGRGDDHALMSIWRTSRYGASEPRAFSARARAAARQGGAPLRLERVEDVHALRLARGSADRLLRGREGAGAHRERLQLLRARDVVELQPRGAGRDHA